VSCMPFRSDFLWMDQNVHEHSMTGLTEQTTVDGVGEVGNKSDTNTSVLGSQS
jgi:hypothetical protein